MKSAGHFCREVGSENTTFRTSRLNAAGRSPLPRGMSELARILGGVSGTEALAVYNALAQWADNERNGLEETDEPDAKHAATVALVEGVVARLEAELVKGV